MTFLHLVDSLANLNQSSPEQITKAYAYLADKKLLNSHVNTIKSLTQAEIIKTLKVLSQHFYSQSNRQRAKLLLDAAYFILKTFNTYNKIQICNTLRVIDQNCTKFTIDSHRDLNLARERLENSEQYNKEGVVTDPIILAISINNLSCLNLKLKNYQQAFQDSFNLVDPLQIYCNKLRQEKHKNISESILVLVNTYYILIRALKGIIRELPGNTSSKQIGRYQKKINQFMMTGHVLSYEFLGKHSLFSHFFRMSKQIKMSEFIPVYLKPAEKNDLQEERIKEEVAREVELKFTPRIEELKNLFLVKCPEGDPSGVALLYQAICKVDDYYTLASKLFESLRGRFGLVKLILRKNNQIIDRQTLSQETVESIRREAVTIRNLPFSVQPQTCTPFQFLKYFINPHIKIEPGQKITLSMDISGLLKPITIDFLKEKASVIVTHICCNSFRICIHSNLGYFYINLQIGTFDHQSYDVIKQVYDTQLSQNTAISMKPQLQEIQRITKFFQSELNSFSSYAKGYIAQKVVTDPQQLQKVVINAVQSTEALINKYYLPKYSLAQIYNSQVFSFKFLVFNFHKPQSHVMSLRYQQNSYFEVTIQDQTESYSPEGKTFAEGVGVYRLQELLMDFGVEITDLGQAIGEKQKLFETILMLFTLNVYNKELTQMQKLLYISNRICRLPVMRRIFKRFYIRQRYYLPATAVLLSVSGRQPLGVKITVYSAEQIIQRGVFLTLDRSKWHRSHKPVCNKMDETKMAKLSSRRYILEFSMISDYTIAEVLEKGGFDIIFDNFVQNPNTPGSYCVKVNNCYLRWTRLESIITMDKLRKKVQKNTQKE